MFRNVFRKSNLCFRSKRLSSSTASEASSSSSLIMAVTATFGTYMLADFLSNFLQHPTQKLRSPTQSLANSTFFFTQMDYGYLNQFIGRPVDQAFWNTRTQHIIGVAACLAVTDHASQVAFAKYLGKTLCFAKSPAAFVAHTFVFIFTGVAVYVAGDAALNPTVSNDKRMDVFLENTYCTYVGTNTAWFEPYVSPVLARVAGSAIAASWFGSSLLPATLAYTTVKGVGWSDWGNQGLNDHELRMNGLMKGSLEE
ncbi:hypothetical protein MPSEU_000620700 [Mayamaea pseudoterrestris]|nr:hypothetical protein MPSEU_000620700 [Mayamaea pseudoterrestris]